MLIRRHLFIGRGLLINRRRWRRRLIGCGLRDNYNVWRLVISRVAVGGVIIYRDGHGIKRPPKGAEYAANHDTAPETASNRTSGQGASKIGSSGYWPSPTTVGTTVSVATANITSSRSRSSDARRSYRSAVSISGMTAAGIASGMTARKSAPATAAGHTGMGTTGETAARMTAAETAAGMATATETAARMTATADSSAPTATSTGPRITGLRGSNKQGQGKKQNHQVLFLHI